MSRITKEEIEKTKCGRFLLSDENIYLSIYSLNSYVFEYNLLNTEDRILYHRLQDKFDARLINGVITRVREQIIELFDKDKYIEAKVYFKPKKLSENGELEFRPLHSTGLITQIAIVSMLHLFVYEIPEEEEGDPKLRLSNLSRLIPSDFYGNRVSVKPEYLFKPWKQQYQKYNQNSNDALMKYHTSLEYKYEVTLDLENFFPTINPIIIYRYIINHLPAYLNDEERKMMKRVLQKLLFCKLTTTFDEKTAGQYYKVTKGAGNYDNVDKIEQNEKECWAFKEKSDKFVKVIYKQLDRIQQLIEKMEPTDIRVKHREWYLGNRYLFDKRNYANRWKMLEDKKLSAVKEIFDEYGSEEVERFGCAVKNVHDVANKLGRFLQPNEMSSIIEKCFIGILSKEFTINCLISFVYTQGAEKLLETSLCQMEDEFMLEILSKIPFSLQLLDVINQVLDDDTAYWEKGAMPYSCYDAEELKIIVEKLVVCKRYVTAVNIIGHSECEAVINAGCIYKLMKLAGTEESIGVEMFDDYAVQKIIGWFQQQEDIDLELRSDIEFIYLPMLDDYSEVRPRALNTRLSLEPEYFCSLIELCYKERNGEKREIELNKSLSDRLYEILFQFKVIPGIDWNGNFDAKRFDYWMKTVKTWSRDNDRYEVAMHTVGSGLSYAELDEDKLDKVYTQD